MSVASAFIQLLQQAMLEAQISSAGGDSPKTNRVLYMDINSADYESVIDAEITMLVEGIVRDEMQAQSPTTSLTDGGGGGEVGEGGGGLTEGEAVGLARQGLTVLRDPTSLVGEALSKLPHAVLIGFALSLIPIIINELTKPGGPFDLRFKRIVEKEFNSLMDRQTAYDIRIGERSIIVQSRAGFINANGAASNTNTLREIREGGVNKEFLNEVDYIDHSRGLF